jgi:rhamnosyltransferase
VTEARQANITVVIRSYNEMPYTAATLEMLPRQRRQDFDVVIVDTGSTDGSVEEFKKFASGRGKKYNPELIQIPVEQYNPGRVLNMAIGKSAHEIVVLLNADAVPRDEFWLERLVEPLEKDEKVAAAFSRQLPQSDTRPLCRRDTLWLYPEKDEPERFIKFVHYSHVGCAIRKKRWQEHPVTTATKRTCEDVEWGRWALGSGYIIRYVPDSAVYHAHNYTLKSFYRRMLSEGEDSAAAFSDIRASVLDSAKSWAGAVLRDIAWCVRNGHFCSIFYSPFLRAAQNIARYKGRRRGLKRRSAETARQSDTENK